ncbi:MAG: beta-N-acetylhexosaminidase [Ruminococcus sp.]|nr:beta-N-acetylhexosaminidase [Ruminococcus sp.]
MSNLIPMPKNIIETTDRYSFEKSNASFFASPELSKIEGMLELIMRCPFKSSSESPCISFIFDESEDKESYSLIIDKSGARVFASAFNGAFYGLQTLRQLFEADLPNKKILFANYTRITNDSPAYGWRGLQLDEGRHFFGKDVVKKMLDFMAMYKLNVFHWHLTDDQGWRIEIEKYPLLTEVGSKRKYSQIGNWQSLKCDNTPVSGYYTKDDIREIVEYAKERCIEIVPEIDFPAHCASALASYNHLACRDIDCEVPGYFGGKIPESHGNRSWNRTLCLGKDEVYQFVFDVIDEVAPLFPFKYFHIGGDEAPKDEWKKCSLCQKKMAENNLKDEAALQGYFINRVNEHLKQHGKTLVGWNEVLQADLLDRDIVVQYWTPKKDRKVTDHIKQGGKIIMSCHKSFYFDMHHIVVPTKSTYTFNPLNNNVPKDMLSSVIGFEGENWTEWTENEEQLFFKMFNRTLALSECVWSDSSVKNYDSFCKRIQRHKDYMNVLGIYYGPDEITMTRAAAKKAIKAKQMGLNIKDFNCEFEMSKV